MEVLEDLVYDLVSSGFKINFCPLTAPLHAGNTSCFVSGCKKRKEKPLRDSPFTIQSFHLHSHEEGDIKNTSPRR